MPLGVRSNSGVPSSSSSPRMRRVSGGWDMCKRRAARPKCASSATTTNDSSCTSDTAPTIPANRARPDTHWVLDPGVDRGHDHPVAIVIHAPHEVDALVRAGQVAAATLDLVCAALAPGVSTAEIDAWVRRDTQARGATPSQLGFHGFPGAVCTSVGAVVCHGVPSPQTVLREGDIVNVDVTSCFEGYHGDTSRTVRIGSVSEDSDRVTTAAEGCMWAGIEAVRAGARLGDVGAAIEAHAKAHDCHIVREFGGHGIGRRMHMPPHVEHHGRPGCGPRLRPGMAFTIEPILTLHPVPLVFDEDGWTCRTADGSPSAQFEHTLVVTDDGPLVTTRLPLPNA